MFTGIIETVGTVREVRQADRAVVLAVEPGIAYDVKVGDSVAVDGVCLTVETVSGGMIRFTAVAETIARTTLGQARPGRRVNLERALRVGDRLGGHFVLGHVDGVGRVVNDRREGASTVRRIWAPEQLRAFFPEKGSVTLDGMSLTIAACFDDGFSVALIPHTLGATHAGTARPGDEVNIECDVLVRYIFHLIKHGHAAPGAGDGAPAVADRTLLDKMESLGF